MNDEPEVIKEFSRKFLLGWVKVDYLVEDRRPDVKMYPEKFKHLLTLRIGGARFNWTFRTDQPYPELPWQNER